jgi:hypothetical protein
MLALLYNLFYIANLRKGSSGLFLFLFLPLLDIANAVYTYRHVTALNATNQNTVTNRPFRMAMTKQYTCYTYNHDMGLRTLTFHTISGIFR